MESKPQDRMLMMDHILTFLGVSQDWIEESKFENCYSFEKKREYDPSENKMEVLYIPPHKKRDTASHVSTSKEPKVLSARVSMFEETIEPSVPMEK